MLMPSIMAYLLLGCMAGLLSGTLGLGGGVVIVPALLLTLPALGVDADMSAHLAVATSLATIAVTSLSSVWAHHQAQAIRWSLVMHLSMGIVFGAFTGAVVASVMPGLWLKTLFGFFAIVIGLQMLMAARSAVSRPEAGLSERLPASPGLVVAGALIGFLSSIFGIGGGSLTVPWLSWCRVKMQQAVATAAAGGFPIAVGGCAGFIYHGWQAPGLPEGSLGYVYLPAALAIIITSFPFARLGAKVAHRLPSAHLKQLFALVLCLIGARLLWAG